MIHRLLLAGIPATILGCAGSPPASDPGSNDPGPVGAAASRAANDEPGLIVERLRIVSGQPSPDPVISMLEPLDSNIEGSAAFKGQGFLALVISEDQLDLLESNLAPTAFAGRTWHGEATGWRSTASRRLSDGNAMLIEGRSRRISNQILTLAIRGWSIPTVEGSELYVEVVPHIAGGRLNLLEAPRQIGELRGTTLSEVLTCSLKPDQCLLLVSNSDLESPSATESDPPTTGGGPDREQGGFDGPVVALPPTAAGWLLDDPISGDRGVLLIHGRPHPAFQPPPETR